jgi:hypothetical protein
LGPGSPGPPGLPFCSFWAPWAIHQAILISKPRANIGLGLIAKSLPKLGPSPSSPQEGQASQLQQLTGGHVPHFVRGERCGRLEASSSLPQLFLFTRMAMSLIPRWVKRAAALRTSSSLPQLFLFTRVAMSLIPRGVKGSAARRASSSLPQLFLFTRVAALPLFL